MKWSARKISERSYSILLNDTVVGGALSWPGRTIAWIGNPDYTSVSEVQECSDAWALKSDLKEALSSLRQKVETWNWMERSDTGTGTNRLANRSQSGDSSPTTREMENPHGI